MAQSHDPTNAGNHDQTVGPPNNVRPTDIARVSPCAFSAGERSTGSHGGARLVRRLAHAPTLARIPNDLDIYWLGTSEAVVALFEILHEEPQFSVVEIRPVALRDDT